MVVKLHSRVFHSDRVSVPFDCLLDELSYADNFGDGYLFHHRYLNNRGIECDRLSEFNTGVD